LCMAEVANHICYYAHLHVQFSSLNCVGFYIRETVLYSLLHMDHLCPHTPEPSTIHELCTTLAIW
jgi:hypothetical protein